MRDRLRVRVRVKVRVGLGFRTVREPRLSKPVRALDVPLSLTGVLDSVRLG